VRHLARSEDAISRSWLVALLADLDHVFALDNVEPLVLLVVQVPGRPDTLRGTDGDDNLIGKGGNDRLFSLNGRDTLLGGPGKDWVDTNPPGFSRGDKNLLGGPGNDIVFGGWSSDKVVGEEGNDFLADGPPRDVALDIVSGGAGTDVIPVASLRLEATAKDIVTCGSGFDRVWADTKDVVAPDCEKVVLFRGGSASEYFDELDEFFAEVPPSFFEGLQPGVF
jgi:Ca2+-binding RTX toxin-like protein